MSHKEIQDAWQRGLVQLVLELDHRLVQNKVIDTKNSGSTGVLLLVHKLFVACASLGDSQAFVFSQASHTKADMVIEELSTVHTPDDPTECVRITSHGGSIRRALNKFGEESGPLRVFQGQSKVPGLMMTRSFGDEIGHYVGLSSLPSSRLL